ncbi:ABC transporter substrate-binding protein [candidate division KSB3 bacterium]|uniref:ABC transporter substrate-binding protein n=1 Tax=candidate division KSB3 bacterium TaxID=2044937 RepID=A0A2G6EGK0_9BACT|nr:MAG: ABC transporter substrate-binding protein [candidate division KSB3 bacterium]PIE31105.1 MAG: ABC transporter substrate-binding protein [candidate division KSB3 bacterium]
MYSIQRILMWGLVTACIMGTPLMSGAEDKIVITMTGSTVGQEGELIRAGAKLYMEQHPNVEIRVYDVPDSTTARFILYLKKLVAQSPEIDLYQVDVIWPGEMAEHFIDLYQYGAEEYVDEHFAALIQNNTVDGRLVAMPWFMDAGLLYYRSDLLKKYGYAAPPSTWDELEKMAKTIQDGEVAVGRENFWGFVWQGDMYEGLSCNVLEWIASSGGGTFLDAEKNITINNPEALRALERAKDWIGYISPPAVTGFLEEDARRWWQSGNAVFMRNWPYVYGMANADDSPVRGKFDLAPLPGEKPGMGAATLGGWQLAVSKYSRHPAVAADIALFMSSKTIQKMRAIQGSFNPTIPSLYDDPDVLKAAPFFGSLYDVFVNAVARPSAQTAPQYSRATRVIFSAVHHILTGQRDVQAALDELEIDLQDVLEAE